MGDCTAELEQEVSVKASEQFEDLQLIHRSQAGDTEAFGELVTKYRTKIFNMVCCIVRNENDAWDLAQEAFLKAWRLIDRFQGRSSFYTWLYSITMNLNFEQCNAFFDCSEPNQYGLASDMGCWQLRLISQAMQRLLNLHIQKKNKIALRYEPSRSFPFCYIDRLRLGDAAKRAPLQVIQGGI